MLQLKPGDCFILGIDEIETVDAVPCGDVHNAEVFSILELAPTDWPGSQAIAQVTEKGCVDRFRSATGHPFDPVHVAITGYGPSERSWGDDRKVLCVVTTHDLGSVRGRVTRWVSANSPRVHHPDILFEVSFEFALQITECAVVRVPDEDSFGGVLHYGVVAPAHRLRKLRTGFWHFSVDGDS